jgi:hypothetical protein
MKKVKVGSFADGKDDINHFGDQIAGQIAHLNTPVAMMHAVLELQQVYFAGSHNPRFGETRRHENKLRFAASVAMLQAIADRMNQ